MNDDTTKKIIERISIIYPEPTKLPSGHISKTFFDCVQLTPNELVRLAAQAVGDLSQDSFDLVLGLAYSGILFASALAGGRGVVIMQSDGRLFGPEVKGKKVLIADDVIHSGDKVKRAKLQVESVGGLVVGFSCIVHRLGERLAGEGLPIYSAYQTEL